MVHLKKQTGGLFTIVTGWMTYPDGIDFSNAVWEKKMKEFDRVELIKDRAEYKKEGVKSGDIGTVMLVERNGYVLVFFDSEYYRDENGCVLMHEKEVGVRIEDLKNISDSDK